VGNLAAWIGEKTIFNQSLQEKSKELTLELSKRKQEIEGLRQMLENAKLGIFHKVDKVPLLY
jgi:hypothetical protein